MSEIDASSVSLEERIKTLLLEDKAKWNAEILSLRKPSPQALVILPESVLNVINNVDREAKKYMSLVNEELQSLREQLDESDACCKKRLEKLRQANEEIEDLNCEVRKQYDNIKELEIEITEANEEINLILEDRAKLLEDLELHKVREYNNKLYTTPLEEEVATLKEHCIITSQYITETEEAIHSAIKILARKKSKK